MAPTHKFKFMRYTSVLFFAVILLCSCDKKDGLTYAERKAVGQYKFEKVTVIDDFVRTENITQQYNNMILQLNDKKEAAIIDQNNSITYLGRYDVITQTTTGITDDDGNTSTNSDNTIIIDIKSPGRGNNQFYWVGENASFSNRKMKFTVHKGGSRYQFRLDKM